MSVEWLTDNNSKIELKKNDILWDFLSEAVNKKGTNEITNASNQFGFVVRDLSRQQIRSKVRKTRFDKKTKFLIQKIIALKRFSRNLFLKILYPWN